MFNKPVPNCFTADHPFKGLKGGGTVIWIEMQSWINFLAVATDSEKSEGKVVVPDVETMWC